MALDRVKLKKFLKEKGIKSLDDFSAFMRDVSKGVIEILLEEELTDHLGFEKYDQNARAMIYTTNPIESLHRKIKKVSKNKSIFPNEPALFKLTYLAVEEAAKKWTMRQSNWAMIYSPLMIFFEDRMERDVLMGKRIYTKNLEHPFESK